MSGTGLIFQAGRIQKVEAAQIQPADLQATSEKIDCVLGWLREAHPELREWRTAVGNSVPEG